MNKEQVQLLSFEIIANAGDAKYHYTEAVRAAESYDFERSEREMKEASAAVVKAHQSQTDLLNAEINGEEIPFSIILIHSQDHLMNAMNYELNARDTIDIYKKLSSIEKTNHNGEKE